jgi:hypothetical protein
MNSAWPKVVRSSRSGSTPQKEAIVMTALTRVLTAGIGLVAGAAIGAGPAAATPRENPASLVPCPAAQAYYPELGGCQNLYPAGNGAYYPVDSTGQPARPVTPPVRPITEVPRPVTPPVRPITEVPRPVTPPVRPITEVPRHATELPGPVKKPTAYLPLDNSGNPVCPAGKAYYPHLKGCYPLYPVG